MNKHEFINKIIVQFMSKADTEQAKIYAENLDRHLKPYWDFDILYEKVCLEWTKHSEPTISFLTEKPRTAPEYIEEMKKEPVYWNLYAKRNGIGFEYEFPFDIKIDIPTARAILAKNRPEAVVTGNNREKIMRENRGDRG